MVDPLVLEASSEESASSSLALDTIGTFTQGEFYGYHGMGETGRESEVRDRPFLT